MAQGDKTYEQELVEFVESIDKGREDTARSGAVPPQEARRILDQATTRGLQRRERRRRGVAWANKRQAGPA